MPPAALPIDKPAYLLQGSADLLKERAADALIEALLPADQLAMGLRSLDGAEVSVGEIVEAIRTTAMFTDRQVVLVQRVDRLSRGDQERLAEGLAAAAPGTVVILVTGEEDPAARRGPSAARALLEAVRGRGFVQSFDPPRQWDLPEWAVREASDLGKRLPPRAASLFVSMVGQDLARLRGELEKLALYVGDRADIDEEDVRAVVSRSAEHTIFELVDAVGQRRAADAVAVLPSLLPESGRAGAALATLGMVARQLRLIWQARFLADLGYSLNRLDAIPEAVQALLPKEHNILDAVRNRAFLVKRYAQQASNFTQAQLAAALRRVFRTEMILKGQIGDAGGDEQLLLELMVADLCRA